MKKSVVFPLTATVLLLLTIATVIADVTVPACNNGLARLLNVVSAGTVTVPALTNCNIIIENLSGVKTITVDTLTGSNFTVRNVICDDPSAATGDTCVDFAVTTNDIVSIRITNVTRFIQRGISMSNGFISVVKQGLFIQRVGSFVVEDCSLVFPSDGKILFSSGSLTICVVDIAAQLRPVANFTFARNRITGTAVEMTRPIDFVRVHLIRFSGTNELDSLTVVDSYSTLAILGASLIDYHVLLMTPGWTGNTLLIARNALIPGSNLTTGGVLQLIVFSATSNDVTVSSATGTVTVSDNRVAVAAAVSAQSAGVALVFANKRITNSAGGATSSSALTLERNTVSLSGGLTTGSGGAATISLITVISTVSGFTRIDINNNMLFDTTIATTGAACTVQIASFVGGITFPTGISQFEGIAGFWAHSNSLRSVTQLGLTTMSGANMIAYGFAFSSSASNAVQDAPLIHITNSSVTDLEQRTSTGNCLVVIVNTDKNLALVPSVKSLLLVANSTIHATVLENTASSSPHNDFGLLRFASSSSLSGAGSSVAVDGGVIDIHSITSTNARVQMRVFQHPGGLYSISSVTVRGIDVRRGDFRTTSLGHVEIIFAYLELTVRGIKNVTVSDNKIGSHSSVVLNSQSEVTVAALLLLNDLTDGSPTLPGAMEFQKVLSLQRNNFTLKQVRSNLDSIQCSILSSVGYITAFSQIIVTDNRIAVVENAQSTYAGMFFAIVHAAGAQLNAATIAGSSATTAKILNVSRNTLALTDSERRMSAAARRDIVVAVLWLGSGAITSSDIAAASRSADNFDSIVISDNTVRDLSILYRATTIGNVQVFIALLNTSFLQTKSFSSTNNAIIWMYVGVPVSVSNTAYVGGNSVQICNVFFGGVVAGLTTSLEFRNSSIVDIALNVNATNTKNVPIDGIVFSGDVRLAAEGEGSVILDLSNNTVATRGIFVRGTAVSVVCFDANVNATSNVDQLLVRDNQVLLSRNFWAVDRSSTMAVSVARLKRSFKQLRRLVIAGNSMTFVPAPNITVKSESGARFVLAADLQVIVAANATTTVMTSSELIVCNNSISLSEIRSASSLSVLIIHAIGKVSGFAVWSWTGNKLSSNNIDTAGIELTMFRTSDWLIGSAERSIEFDVTGNALVPGNISSHGGVYLEILLCDKGFESVSRIVVARNSISDSRLFMTSASSSTELASVHLSQMGGIPHVVEAVQDTALVFRDNIIRNVTFVPLPTGAFEMSVAAVAFSDAVYSSSIIVDNLSVVQVTFDTAILVDNSSSHIITVGGFGSKANGLVMAAASSSGPFPVLSISNVVLDVTLLADDFSAASVELTAVTLGSPSAEFDSGLRAISISGCSVTLATSDVFAPRITMYVVWFRASLPSSLRSLSVERCSVLVPMMSAANALRMTLVDVRILQFLRGASGFIDQFDVTLHQNRIGVTPNASRAVASTNSSFCTTAASCSVVAFTPKGSSTIGSAPSRAIGTWNFTGNEISNVRGALLALAVPECLSNDRNAGGPPSMIFSRNRFDSDAEIAVSTVEGQRSKMFNDSNIELSCNKPVSVDTSFFEEFDFFLTGAAVGILTMNPCPPSPTATATLTLTAPPPLPSRTKTVSITALDDNSSTATTTSATSANNNQNTTATTSTSAALTTTTMNNNKDENRTATPIVVVEEPFLPIAGETSSAVIEAVAASSNVIAGMAALGGGAPVTAMTTARVLSIPQVAACTGRDSSGRKWTQTSIGFPASFFPGFGIGGDATAAGFYARGAVVSHIIMLASVVALALVATFIQQRNSKTPFFDGPGPVLVMRVFCFAFAQVLAQFAEAGGLLVAHDTAFSILPILFVVCFSVTVVFLVQRALNTRRLVFLPSVVEEVQPNPDDQPTRSSDGGDSSSSSRIYRLINGTFIGRFFITGVYAWRNDERFIPTPLWAVVRRFHGRDASLLSSQAISLPQRIRTAVTPHAFAFFAVFTMMSAFCTGVAKAASTPSQCRTMLSLIAVANCFILAFELLFAPLLIVPARNWLLVSLDFVAAVLSSLVAAQLGSEEAAREKQGLVEFVNTATIVFTLLAIVGVLLVAGGGTMLMRLGNLQIVPSPEALAKLPQAPLTVSEFEQELMSRKDQKQNRKSNSQRPEQQQQHRQQSQQNSNTKPKHQTVVKKLVPMTKRVTVRKYIGNKKKAAENDSRSSSSNSSCGNNNNRRVFHHRSSYVDKQNDNSDSRNRTQSSPARRRSEPAAAAAAASSVAQPQQQQRHSAREQSSPFRNSREQRPASPSSRPRAETAGGGGNRRPEPSLSRHNSSSGTIHNNNGRSSPSLRRDSSFGDRHSRNNNNYDDDADSDLQLLPVRRQHSSQQHLVRNNSSNSNSNSMRRPSSRM